MQIIILWGKLYMFMLHCNMTQSFLFITVSLNKKFSLQYRTVWEAKWPHG